ncbi:MAG: MFS transporter, partial [Chloroflexota bacterium]
VTLPFLLPTLILEFNLSYFQAGLLTLATSLFSGILQPIVGYAADRYAKLKLIMQLGFVAFSAGLVLAGLSNSFSLLWFAFFIFGLGQATFHAQSTNLITRAFPDAKGRAMGIHGIGGSIGNFSAPILATLLIAPLGWRNAAFLLAIPALLTLVLIRWWLAEPAKSEGEAKAPAFSISPTLLVLALNFGLLHMVYIGFLAFLPTYLVENGFLLEQAGIISALMLFVGFFAQPAGGLIFDRVGGRLLFMGSSIFAGAALLLLTIGSGLPIIPIIMLFGAAVTATFPVTLAMGSAVAQGQHVGTSVGLVFGLSGVLSAFAPSLTGYVAYSFGLQQSFYLLVLLAALSFSVSFLLPAAKSD